MNFEEEQKYPADTFENSSDEEWEDEEDSVDMNEYIKQLNIEVGMDQEKEAQEEQKLNNYDRLICQALQSVQDEEYAKLVDDVVY